MENFAGKKRPTINLSIFTNFPRSFSPLKSPRYFEGDTVGLGTAMNSPPPLSPVPIVLSPKPATNFRGGLIMERDAMDESYTCVISRSGNNSVKKRVYFNDEIIRTGLDDSSNSHLMNNAAMFFIPPPNLGEVKKREYHPSSFMNSCYVCRKQLNGLHIITFKEKAFCSTDCRDKQVKSDNYRDRCKYQAREALDYYVPPCPEPYLPSPFYPGEFKGREFEAAYFLSCCYLCKKWLHGQDIFMYSEEAFCSNDCRNKQIKRDARKEKCRTETIKPLDCPGLMLLLAGAA